MDIFGKLGRRPCGGCKGKMPPAPVQKTPPKKPKDGQVTAAQIRRKQLGK